MSENQTKQTKQINNNRTNQIIVNAVAEYLDHISKLLPDDVVKALTRLRTEEKNEAAASVYETMFRNMKMAEELDKPLCQDTGIVQFKVICGSEHPAIGEIGASLREAVIKATKKAPLRPNCIETFDETNTGDNTGSGAPAIWWEIEPGRSELEIYVYLAGGGCSLPGIAKVFMPGQGYEVIAPFVAERVTEMGLNACPPLFIGVGIGNSIETAAMNSKLALMRDVDSSNENPKAAALEKELEEKLNYIGIGPQGLGGSSSVMGVNIVNTVRHPATLAVAVSFGCWCHRRGVINFDEELNYRSKTHSKFLK